MAKGAAKNNIKAAKEDMKKKEKIVEDKTFGMKNKNKSSKVQKYINTMKQSVQQAHKKTIEEIERKKAETNAKKDAKKTKAEELNQLFKAVVTSQKVPVGVNPKTIVCEYFKRGQCTKGAKCKFSHDVAVDRKVTKIDMYMDPRDVKMMEDIMRDKGEDMDNWDQATLESIVAQRHVENNDTDIVCKYFLEAIEKKQYGFRWVCPNGNDCKYRHRLPPGYALKTKQAVEEKKEDICVEDIIEQERAKLAASGKVGTPLTHETFKKWKADKAARKVADIEKKKKEAESKGNRGTHGLSGRDLFIFDPSMFVDDDGAAADADYDTTEDALVEGETSQGDPLYDPSAQDAPIQEEEEEETKDGSEEENEEEEDDESDQQQDEEDEDDGANEQLSPSSATESNRKSKIPLPSSSSLSSSADPKLVVGDASVFLADVELPPDD